MLIRKILLSISWIFFVQYVFGSTPEDGFIFGENHKVALRGEWNLVMNEFLDHDEALANDDFIKAPVPGTWNELEWNGEQIGPYGYGTYYKKVIIDQKSARSLAIEVSEISLAYRLFINNELIGQRGVPGISLEKEHPKMDHGIFDFKANTQDTITIIFHVSNFRHESGGVWYAPYLGTETELRADHDFNKGITLIIVGSFIIGAFFQLYVFFRRREEKFGLYFFLGSVSLIMLTISRGEMLLLDFFPNTSWIVLKKVLYLSIFTLAAFNGLFLMELFPKYFHRRIIQAMVVIALAASLFTFIAPPKLVYVLIPPYHAYNGVVGIYMLWSLIRAAYANKFGARFLLVGYGAGFVTALHDMLSSQYIIQGYSFAMIHVGTIIYILQLLAVIAGRYIFALNGKEQLSNHLKKVNEELEEMIARRTKALREKNFIIETKNSELEKAMKEKDHLMAVVAHDLKAPFNTILSFSELMTDEVSGKAGEFNDIIIKVSQDGRKLIDNLTELKTYEQDSFKIEKEEIDVDTFFDEKCVSFSKLAEEKEISFQSNLDKDFNIIKCNKSVLGRIVDNLLSNAVKFTSSQGNVEFTFKVTDDHFVVQVKDNGPGFSDSDKEKAFEKFQKLSARPTAGESSTGLGLSIVKILTEKLNGSIELISEPNQGSEFIITIPNS